MYRYIGNKTKLSEVIVDKIEELVGKKKNIADIMAGTGAISNELKKRGYKVFANDVMTYSKYHLIVTLNMNEYPDFKNINELKVVQGISNRERFKQCLNYLNSLVGVEGYFFNEFSPDGIPQNNFPKRKYFSSKNAKKIDAIRIKINEWESKNLLNLEEISILKHVFVLGVNRVANISGTYGYFLSKLSANAQKEFEMRFFELDTSKNINHEIHNSYAELVAKEFIGDLCYIDPPYIKRQYAANYHILETIARGDEPVPEGKSGLRPWRDQYSNFCSKRKIRGAFREILTSINCNIVLISYSEDGLLSLEELVDFLKEFGYVKVNIIEYKRFKSNSSSLKSELKEYLIEVHFNRIC